MSRIQNNRKPPRPEDLAEIAAEKAAKLAAQKKKEKEARAARTKEAMARGGPLVSGKAVPAQRTRINKQSRKRMDANAEYSAVIEVHRENNPDCPGCGGSNEQFHHIARGPDRTATLTNTDLGIGGCRECHEQWDDKGKTPVPMQFAIKFRGILKRYEEITRKRIDTKEVIKFLLEMEGNG